MRFIRSFRLYSQRTFCVEGEKNNLSLERSVSSVPFEKVYLLPKFGGCSHFKIRGCKILWKSPEAFVTEAKSYCRLKWYFLQRVTSEFCNPVTSEFDNEWQGNSTTNNEWILKEASFAMSNTQVLLLITK